NREPVFKTTTIVLTYLLAILIASTIWGLGVSLFMTVAATLLCDYYFFLPIGILSIDDPQDWVALISFFVTSVIGSELSARARRQAQEAKRQRDEVGRLYEFSQRLLNAQDPGDLLNEIPSGIVELFESGAAALYLSGKQTIHHSGKDLSELDAAHLKAVQDSGNVEIDIDRGFCYSPVRLGNQVIGSI